MPLSCAPFTRSMLRPTPWLCLLLTACASAPLPEPPAALQQLAPAQWQAPVPAAADASAAHLAHHGSAVQLHQWWTQWGDPVLLDWMAAAQQASPSVAAARTRLAQAQAARVDAQAALEPAVAASANASRGLTQWPMTVNTSAHAGLMASWELDLFGQRHAARDAAQARLDGAQAQWHEARVSVAAEVALQWVGWQTCQQQLQVVEADAASRRQTARLSTLSTAAGLTAPSQDAQAQAAAAEGHSSQTQQAARCELTVKALAALTALPEPDLRSKLMGVRVEWTDDAINNIALPVLWLPAKTLAQRPDVQAAARAVEAARADISQADAARYPSLGLSGSVGAQRVRSGGVTSDLSTWSIGPLSLSVPVLDGGRRQAVAASARVAYDEAVVAYGARVRQAVREVEEALVYLQSSASRGHDAAVIRRHLNAALQAAERRMDAGLASRAELEESRRQALAAQSAWLALQQERLGAWVALYRAAGGGWEPAI